MFGGDDVARHRRGGDGEGRSKAAFFQISPHTYPNMKESFDIVPASGVAVWVTVILVVLLLALLTLFGRVLYSARNTTVQVESEGLRISGTLYGRLIPLESLRLDEARVLDLERDAGYRLKWRTNGIGLPGYKAGWFRLRNGEKALAFITDTRRILYLPTREGFSVLLSVAQPVRMLELLHKARPNV